MQLRSGVSPLLQLVPSSSQNMAQVLFSSKYGTSFRKFPSYINAFLSCTIFYHQAIIIIVKYQCNFSWCRFVLNILTDDKGICIFLIVKVCKVYSGKAKKVRSSWALPKYLWTPSPHLSPALFCMSLKLPGFLPVVFFFAHGKLDKMFRLLKIFTILTPDFRFLIKSLPEIFQTN